MRKRLTRKEKRNRNKKIVITGVICLLFCLCVGYSAFNTELSIRAKGNIKESENCEFGGIKVNTVTEGDGLYFYTYEEGKCTYKGTNPNNYIRFNNEMWRIISIASDNSIKIIRNESLGRIMWDSSGSLNNWDEPASLNTYLNSEYLSTISINKDKMLFHTWSIGAITQNNNDLSDQIKAENGTLSKNAIVGLITVSEYLRGNSNIQQCENFNINNKNATICLKTNWLADLQNLSWTISPVFNSESLVFGINDGNIVTNCLNPVHVFPSLYLSSNTTLLGTGTEQDPYVITN